jgi:DNA-binding beta-propeller fold protein YncE
VELSFRLNRRPEPINQLIKLLPGIPCSGTFPKKKDQRKEPMKKLRNISYPAFALVALSAALLLGLAQPGSAQSATAPHEKSPVRSSVSSPTSTGAIFVLANLDDKVTRINAQTGQSTPIPLASGASPLRIAKHPTAARAYVCDCGTGTVTVFNTNNGQIVKTISQTDLGLDCPQELAFNPNGSRLYVVDQYGSLVAVINTTNDNNHVIGQVDIGSGAQSGARAILVRPDNAYVFAANTGKQSVSIFDTSSSPTVSQIDTGGQTRRLAITPQDPTAGSWTVFATVWEGWVTVIQSTGNTNTFVTNIPVAESDGPETRGIAITPDGSERNETYVTNVAEGTVSIIDNSNFDNVTTLDSFAAPWQVTITPDGHYACVSNAGNGIGSCTHGSVTIIDATDQNHSVVATPCVGTGPFFSVSDPDSSRLWVSNSMEQTSAGSVSVITLDGVNFGVQNMPNVGSKPYDLIFVP